MQCEVWSVKESVGSEKCEVWSVKFKFGVRSAQCEVWSVRFGVWRKQWEVRSAKCEVWSVKFKVWSAKSAVWSVECGVWRLCFVSRWKIKWLSREGHGRDRLSLNYRSFMFGKLPPPACPGLCYIIHYTLYIIQYTWYMIHYTLYTIHIHIHTHMHIRMQILNAHTNAYIHIQIHIHTHMHIHIYILGTDEIGVVGGSSFLISHLMSKVLFLPFEGARLLCHVVLFVIWRIPASSFYIPTTVYGFNAIGCSLDTWDRR